MTLAEAKKEVDHTLAALFYSRMKSITAEEKNAQLLYKQAVEETSQLLLHMKGRLEILFGHDTEALANFLHQAGVTPLAEA